MRLAIIAIGLAATVTLAPPAGELPAGRAVVIDGDTLDVGTVRVRLYGIDAPERGQLCRTAGGRGYDCGARASAELARLIGDRPVRCRTEGEDRYGRRLGVCRAGGVDLNRAMVASGQALAYRRFSDAYVGAEAAARAEGRGLWAGDFAPPWRHRAARRGAAPAGPPDPRCAIKGNVSARGRIYHLPGSAVYARTRIDPARGERWFCSESEALVAGWRPSRR